MQLYQSTRASLASDLANQRVSVREFKISAILLLSSDLDKFAHLCVDAGKRCITFYETNIANIFDTASSSSLTNKIQ